MIKRILMSLGTLAIASGSIVAGTQALLSSSTELTANSLSTGSVNLDISKDGSAYSDSTDSGFSQKILPGKQAVNYVWLKNVGSDTGMQIAAQTANVTGNVDTTKVLIGIVPVDDSNNPLAGSTMVTHSLSEWETPVALNTTVLAMNTAQKYAMQIAVDPTLSTSGSTSFDVVFTGTQSD